MFFEEDGQEFEKDDSFKIDFDDVKSSLEGVKKGSGGWWVGRCKAHEDGRPSLAFIKNGDTTGFHCFAGCSYESIVRSLGLWKDVPEKKAKINRKIAAVYDYEDENGNVRYQVVRFEPKDFRQRRSNGEGGWIWDLDGVPRLLYKLPRLLEPSLEPVFIVEGEKDADNIIKIGGIATTNSGGATKWEKSFNKYFNGRDVVIIADNDISGRDHAELVSKEVYRSALSVKILNLPSDVPKYDVSDFIDEGNGYDELLFLVNELEPLYYTEEDLTVDPTQSHNLEAEMAVLGAIFKNQILIGRAIEADLRKHYFDKKTKSILNAMVECFEASQDIDPITVGDKLGKQKLEQLGGTDFLRSLENNLPQVFDIDSWIKIIVAKSQYRDLVSIGKRLTTLAENEAQGVDYLTDAVLDKVYSVKVEDRRSGFSKLGNDLENVIVTAQEAIGKGIIGIPTGLPDLDFLMSGLQPTDLIIMAGRPSMGKSSLAMNIAAHASIREGKNVGVFSLEMSKEQLIAKVMCGEAFVDSFAFKNGTMQEADWARIAKVLPILDGANLFIDDTAGIGVTEMRSKALRLQQEQGLDLVVIDYLQLMNGSRRIDNRQQEVSQISRDLKAMAKELKVPVIALSQLSRAPETRSNPKPVLSDLRESGSIEQDADVVAFVYRDEYYNQEKADSKGLAEVIIAKQRNGPVGTVQLAWLKQYTRFMPLLEKY
jgi:replicative DNA helicase